MESVKQKIFLQSGDPGSRGHDSLPAHVSHGHTLNNRLNPSLSDHPASARLDSNNTQAAGACISAKEAAVGETAAAGAAGIDAHITPGINADLPTDTNRKTEQSCKKQILPLVLPMIQASGYAGAAAAYFESLRSIEAPAFFHETVLVYSLGLFFLSILLAFVRSPAAVRVVLMSKIALLTLLTYTTMDAYPLTLLLLLILQVELGFRTEHPKERLLFYGLFICCVAGIGLHSNVFGVNVIIPFEEHISITRSLRFIGTLVVFSLITYFLADYMYKTRKLNTLVLQQQNSLDNMSEFNHRLQRWAQAADSQSAERERNRISRELHDISGYMFTNLVALMDAAISTGSHKNPQLTELLNTARQQAQEGLRETRVALRKQREIRSKHDAGLRTIYKICAIFQQVTRTTVQLHFGNLPSTFDSDLNHCLYRIVQESLTNAIRHGKATLVNLQFRIRKNTLAVTIHDNGVGSKEINKGIGLTGIEERVTRHGGSLEAGNSPQGGFRLHIEIPLNGISLNCN